MDSRSMALLILSISGLLRISLDQFRCHRNQVSKEPCRALVGAGGKVELRCRSFIRVVAVHGRRIRKTHAPDTLDHQRLATRIFEQPGKLARVEVVRGNLSRRLRCSTSGEVRNQQMMAELSKVQRSKRHSPRSIQPVAMFQTSQQLALRRINVHVPEPGARSLKWVSRKVQRICDNKIVADRLHVEW